jgi:hypothetical protein
MVYRVRSNGKEFCFLNLTGENSMAWKAGKMNGIPKDVK